MYGMNTNFTLAVTRFADIVTTASSPIPLSLGYAEESLPLLGAMLVCLAVVSHRYRTLHHHPVPAAVSPPMPRLIRRCSSGCIIRNSLTENSRRPAMAALFVFLANY